MFKKLSIMLLLVLTIGMQCIADERPRVAVVLAGGGAKGLAHIGALKVLEESGVPIDMVVGNSMGSIVGGLYAIGYTPAELDSVVRHTDWIKLLIDAPDFDSKLLTSKKMNEYYQLRVSLDPKRHRSNTGRSGIIQGYNIERLLRKLTVLVPDSVDFNTLPLPFACNATEAINGKVYEFHDGNLVEAMRSSMAIPGIFTPVQKDSMLFVDGFVLNNYPVDVAKRLGADIIIGLDLVSTKPAAERYTNITDLVTHMIDVNGSHLYENNISNSNVYIDIDVTEFTSASFGAADIDSMIVRGERRARQMLPALEHLRDSLAGIYGNEKPRYLTAQANRRRAMINREYITSIGHGNDDQERPEGNWFRNVRNNYLSSSINLGARYDNDEYASMQMMAEVTLPSKRHFSASIYGRLGQRLKGGLSLHHDLLNNGRVSVEYFFEHSDLQYFYRGNRAGDVTSNHQRTQISFGQTWHKVLYTFGMRYDWHKYTDLLIREQVAAMAPKLNGKTERYLSYFAQSEFNSQNSIYYPTRGSRVTCNLELVTDNFYQFDGHNAIPIGSLIWSTAATIGSRLTLIPHASARILLTDNNSEPAALQNVMGGLHDGMKVGHQLTVAGIPSLEITSDNAMAVFGLGIQQRMGESHYLQARIDGCNTTNHVDDFMLLDNIRWGAQLGYSYSSIAGPISLTAFWSQRTRNLKLMLNLGYCF